MIDRLAVYPIIQKGSWTFRASVSNSTNIMIMAFGPDGAFMMRHFVDEGAAKAWVDETTAGKHVE